MGILRSFRPEQVSHGRLQQESHADARHLLGVLKEQQAKHAVGVDLIHEAIAQSPRMSADHNNLGKLLLQIGDRLSAERATEGRCG